VGLQNARNLHEAVRVLGGVHQVLGPGQAQARDLAQLLHRQEDVVPRGAQASAHGRAAQVHGPQPLLALEDPPPVAGQGFGPGRALGAQGHGHGVLQLGAAHLDHLPEGALLVLEGLLQQGDGFFQAAQQPDRRDLNRGGEDVVRGLVQVDAPQGVDQGVVALGAAQQLDGPVGQDLVDVHVQGRASAALQGVDDDRPAQVALDHLSAGGLDGRGDFPGQEAKLPVGPSAGQLDHGHGHDQLGVRRPPGQGEVLQGAQGVDAVVGVVGQRPRPQGVSLVSHTVARRIA